MSDLVFAVVVDAAKGVGPLTEVERRLEAIDQIMTRIGNDPRKRIRLFDEQEMARAAAIFFTVLRRMQSEVDTLNRALGQTANIMRGLLSAGGGHGGPILLPPAGGSSGGGGGLVPYRHPGPPMIPPGGGMVPYGGGGALVPYRPAQPPMSFPPGSIHVTASPMDMGGVGLPPGLPAGGGASGRRGFFSGLGGLGRGILGAGMGAMRTGSHIANALMGFGMLSVLMESVQKYESAQLQGMDVALRSGARGRGVDSFIGRTLSLGAGMGMSQDETFGITDAFSGARGRGPSSSALRLAGQLRLGTGVDGGLIGSFLGQAGRYGTSDREMRRLAQYIGAEQAKNPGKLTEILQGIQQLNDISNQTQMTGGGIGNQRAAFGLYGQLQGMLKHWNPGQIVGGIQSMNASMAGNPALSFMNVGFASKLLTGKEIPGQMKNWVEIMAQGGITNTNVPKALQGILKPGFNWNLAGMLLGAARGIRPGATGSDYELQAMEALKMQGLQGPYLAMAGSMIGTEPFKGILTSLDKSGGLRSGMSPAKLMGMIGQASGMMPGFPGATAPKAPPSEAMEIRIAQGSIDELERKVGGPISQTVRDVKTAVVGTLNTLLDPHATINQKLGGILGGIAKLGTIERILIALGLSGGNPVLFGAGMLGMEYMGAAANVDFSKPGAIGTYARKLRKAPMIGALGKILDAIVGDPDDTVPNPGSGKIIPSGLSNPDFKAEFGRRYWWMDWQERRRKPGVLGGFMKEWSQGAVSGLPYMDAIQNQPDFWTRFAMQTKGKPGGGNLQQPWSPFLSMDNAGDAKRLLLEILQKIYDSYKKEGKVSAAGGERIAFHYNGTGGRQDAEEMWRVGLDMVRAQYHQMHGFSPT